MQWLEIFFQYVSEQSLLKYLRVEGRRHVDAPRKIQNSNPINWTSRVWLISLRYLLECECASKRSTGTSDQK